MKLNEIFLKDVNRSIEGVVKADDVDHLGVEVEEYVFTNDAAKWVGPLLEEYTNYTNANGVWISGFFGSGKSHLLKMLAHLLGDVEGQEFPRGQVSDSFLSKTDDAMLTASFKKAATIPAKSLLFNIDQKATLIAKDQTDALLKVFVKVFDESRGYFGNDGAVARFEEDLDKRGQYEAFKTAFREASWHRLGARTRADSCSKPTTSTRLSPRLTAGRIPESSLSTNSLTPCRSKTSPTRSRRGLTCRSPVTVSTSSSTKSVSSSLTT